ncbi:malate dehydrogenase [Phycomyces blakesleeanus]|uniref:Malate dehydrogenase n=2 Tax=Phycomyces blakesleeanus TaxID=4837 RepID=A0A162PKA3_PHYB8|nr:malate dehydrogenase [Phycomyces blakesleeanus NRRL 1555(-)]OAD69656.1 malate dehydrogenase [Phycomyces blakesleeanus NRRL 1555(-)]|eukprot:XP_018287696.1 malate dehydrogenase [Phycomyces blakesleeanus NRRL 1555(-)]
MVKVTVCGAAGGIGQPLSLLLKQSELITHLSLFDIVNTPGVAADLSHINTKSKVTGYVGTAQLEEAIKDSAVVVIPAGVPRKPGMTRDDLFNINGGIVRDLAIAAAKFSPKAFICVISNPVNSTVPIVTEVFKQFGVYDPRKIFGVTTLDIVRASTFVSELIGAEASQLQVPVVGGHSGVTIIPLLSQVVGTSALSEDQIAKVTHRIQFGGDEVVQAKNGAGSATLSMAFAGARFTLNILEAAIRGTSGVVECTYVHLDADKEGAKAIKSVVGDDIEYFSVPVELGINGVQKIKPLGNLSEYEQKLLSEATAELKGNIVKGASFITEGSKF